MFFEMDGMSNKLKAIKVMLSPEMEITTSLKLEKMMFENIFRVNNV
jgi:hypothetical protein